MFWMVYHVFVRVRTAVRNLNLPRNTKGQRCSYGGGQRSGEGRVQAICSVTCQNGILERTSKTNSAT